MFQNQYLPMLTHWMLLLQLPSMRERHRRRGRSSSWGGSLWGSETLVRSVRFMRYCLICSASLFKAMVRLGFRLMQFSSVLPPASFRSIRTLDSAAYALAAAFHA